MELLGGYINAILATIAAQPHKPKIKDFLFIACSDFICYMGIIFVLNKYAIIVFIIKS